MGEPQRPVAGAGEDGVALAIAFEGAAGAVVGPAVGFDREPVVGEDEVDLEAGDVRVDLRPREAVVVAQREHELLEFALRERGVAIQVERALQRGRSALALVGSCHGIEGGEVVELLHLGFVERSLEGAAGEGGGEVEQSPRGGGDRDALVLGDLVGSERRRAVDAQPGALRAAGLAAHGDVDARCARPADLPERCGRRVAQHRAGPGGEHRGHAAPVDGEDAVTDGVDPAVETTQPTLRGPAPHCT